MPKKKPVTEDTFDVEALNDGIKNSTEYRLISLESRCLKLESRRPELTTANALTFGDTVVIGGVAGRVSSTKHCCKTRFLSRKTRKTIDVCIADVGWRSFAPNTPVLRYKDERFIY